MIIYYAYVLNYTSSMYKCLLTDCLADQIPCDHHSNFNSDLLYTSSMSNHHVRTVKHNGNNGTSIGVKKRQGTS